MDWIWLQSTSKPVFDSLVCSLGHLSGIRVSKNTKQITMEWSHNWYLVFEDLQWQEELRQQPHDESWISSNQLKYYNVASLHPTLVKIRSHPFKWMDLISPIPHPQLDQGSDPSPSLWEQLYEVIEVVLHPCLKEVKSQTTRSPYHPLS